MARKEDFRFRSSDGKTMIHGVRWIPDSGEYKAVFQIVHGMVEFIERYEDFGEYLTEHGFLVVGHDHLGHGESVNSREEWGYIAREQGSNCLVRDIHRVRVMTGRQNENLPYFMLGHSMGSYLLRKYVTRYGEGLAGAIVMGTGDVPASKARLAMGMIRMMAAWKGWHFRCPLMEKAVFSGPFKRFNLDGTVPQKSWLTRDVAVVKAYYGDPRCTFHFTLSGFYSLMETVCYDGIKEHTASIPGDLPVFLVSGACDPVGDLGKGVKRVRRKLKEAGVQDVTMKLYEGGRHEILNEINRETVYGDIVKWCRRRADDLRVWQQGG